VIIRSTRVVVVPLHEEMTIHELGDGTSHSDRPWAKKSSSWRRVE